MSDRNAPAPSSSLSKLAFNTLLVGVASIGSYLAYRLLTQPKLKPKSKALTISEIRIYPVKSCRGMSLQNAQIGPGGFKMDRKWMVIDADTNNFLTQRECPQMALVETDLDANNHCLILRIPSSSASKHHEFRVPLLTSDSNLEPFAVRKVRIWKSTCDALQVGDVELTSTLSAYLGRNACLVQMDPRFRRELSANHRLDESNYTDFSDGYPILVASTASLKRISEETKTDLPITRFRPNLVIENESANAWEEDDWRVLNIQNSAVRLYLVKPCSRCEITTIDPAQGRFVVGADILDPLSTLGRIHANAEGAAIFGQNAIPVFHYGNRNRADKLNEIQSGAHALAADAHVRTCVVGSDWPVEKVNADELVLKVGQQVVVAEYKA